MMWSGLEAEFLFHEDDGGAARYRLAVIDQ
jgi:hypothetical protein